MSRDVLGSCIKHTSEKPEFKGKAWCGRYIGFPPQEFCFQSIDHAFYNHAAKGRLLTCPKCLAAVRKNLEEQMEGESCDSK